MRKQMLAIAAAGAIGLAGAGGLSVEPLRGPDGEPLKPRRSKGKQQRPPRKSNRLHISKRVRRKHRRAA